MKFTFWAIGVPLLLMVLDIILRSPHRGQLPIDAFGFLGGLWFLGGCMLVFWYWLVRFIRFCWNQGTAPNRIAEELRLMRLSSESGGQAPQATTRKAGWIYPEQPR